MRVARASWLLILGALLVAGPARGQDNADRLTRSFTGEIHRQLAGHVQQAERSGLPAEALVQKALEGRSKGASDDQIIVAVASLHERLVAAREALGSSASADELESAAAALYVGASPRTLRSIRELHSSVNLAPAFTTLAFLLQYGLGEPESVGVVGALVRAGSTSADFTAFQHDLTSDIGAGRVPSESVRLRLDEYGIYVPASPAGGPVRP